jgi:hypothetical protein
MKIEFQRDDFSLKKQKSKVAITYQQQTDVDAVSHEEFGLEEVFVQEEALSESHVESLQFSESVDKNIPPEYVSSRDSTARKCVQVVQKFLDFFEAGTKHALVKEEVVHAREPKRGVTEDTNLEHPHPDEQFVVDIVNYQNHTERYQLLQKYQHDKMQQNVV